MDDTVDKYYSFTVSECLVNQPTCKPTELQPSRILFFFRKYHVAQIHHALHATELRKGRRKGLHAIEKELKTDVIHIFLN